MRTDKEAADQQEINSQYQETGDRRLVQDKYRTQPITNNSLILYSLLRGLHCGHWDHLVMIQIEECREKRSREKMRGPVLGLLWHLPGPGISLIVTRFPRLNISASDNWQPQHLGWASREMRSSLRRRIFSRESNPGKKMCSLYLISITGIRSLEQASGAAL